MPQASARQTFDQKRIVILGAGISGLSLAWFLQKKFGKSIKITIIEKASRVGGWINSVYKGDFFFELGPRGFRPKGKGSSTLELVYDLGIQKDLIASNEGAKKRYLWKDQKLQKIPNNLFSFFFSSLTRKALFPLLKEPFLKGGEDSDESIEAFSLRRFGRYITENFIDPMISGIFAGDIQELSIASCLPILKEWESSKGSVLRGALTSKTISQKEAPFAKWQKVPLLSFKKGMAFLPESIAKAIDATLLLSQEAQQLTFHDRGISVSLPGQTLFADHLFSTLPAFSLSSLFSDKYKKVHSLLSSFSTASLALVSCGFPSRVLKKNGFGYLIPSKEREPLLGMTWDSDIFPSHNKNPEETRLTAMLGGSHHPDLTSSTQAQLVERVLQNCRNHLDITLTPSLAEVTLVKNAIPQYITGHKEKLKLLKDELLMISPFFTLLGNHFQGVAINDCISHSKEIIKSFELPR